MLVPEVMTPTEFNVALARLGLSGAAFAREIDYSPRAISSWRTERVPIPKLVELYLSLRVKEHNRQTALNSATSNSA